MDLRHYDGSLTKAGAAVGLIVFVLLFIAIWAVAEAVFGAKAAHSADAEQPPCLTREQAKTKFPGMHLYWRTEHKCWYAVGPSTRSNKRTRADRLPDTPLDASGNATTQRVSHIITRGPPYIYYPELMIGGGTTSNMLTPSMAIGWQPVADFDIEPVPFTPWSKARTLFDK